MKKELTFGHGGLVALALVLCLGAAMPRNAQALTMVLDWTTTSTDIFGQTTGAFDAAPWSAIAPTAAGVQSAALAAVIDQPRLSDYGGKRLESIVRRRG